MWEFGVVAGAYLLAHLPFLAPSLEDLDSLNFALGLREFNPAEHQPHPPGYPVYIGLGRVALALVNAIRPALPRVSAEAAALSLCSAVAGALAIMFAYRVFRGLAAAASDTSRAMRTARWAAVLLAVCPLFWLTGVRPMSDMPGLAFAFAAQALMLAGHLPAGAFVTGLGLGLRSQTLWLTAPLLVWVLLKRGVGGWRHWVTALLMAAAGALAWAVPLLLATGGPDAYLAALRSQAGEDFAFVDMLWANPTPRRLAFGLLHTLVLPWASVPLAVLILALAAVGAVVVLLRERTTLLMLLIAFGPYAAFHLVFQETVTVRYALPVVAPIVFLAARALAVAGCATNLTAVPVAVVALVVAIPGLVAYGRDPHPAFRAIDDVARRAEVRAPAMLTSHFELRRPLQAAEFGGIPVAWAPRHREWLELVNYWRNGGRDTVWFLANPRRTDLASIDPHSRSEVVRYRWAVEQRPELSGTRPMGVDWYRLQPPGWFVGEGWSLTAEMGGLTQATDTGPDRKYIEAYVRCRPGPMHLVVGARYLGETTDPAVELGISYEDMGIKSWRLTYEQRNLLEFADIPFGLQCAKGQYARLYAHASPLPDRASPSPVRVRVAIRQFDIQPVNVLIFGFGPGWHEDEYAPESGLRWRWSSDRSVLRVRGPGTVRVRLRGESPLKYFDEAPVVTLSAAGRVYGSVQPRSDFDFDVTVPADAVQAAHGDLVLETTRSFVPAAAGESADVRRLGLRIFDVRVEQPLNSR